MKLEEFFEENEKMAVGFSGGVDSSYLLYAASASGADIAPYFVKTAFQPEFELDDAHRAAEFSNAVLRIVEVDILADRKIVENAADRCYHCKKAIFSAIKDAARNDGYALLTDGTNASDDAGDRPGMRATAELGVVSPLRLCGLTKDEVRLRSREAGLFTHDKPSYSCLATRISTGEKITPDKLHSVESAEVFLMSRGFSDFRVRVSGCSAKIQLHEADMCRLIEIKKETAEYFYEIGLKDISLDLRPR